MTVSYGQIPIVYSETIGDGQSTRFVIEHNLGTEVIVSVYELATGNHVLAPLIHTNHNTVVIEPAYHYIEKRRAIKLGWVHLYLPWLRRWERAPLIPPPPDSLRVVVLG